jgi:hypothetical protein
VNDVAPSELAFRVGIFAGVLGAIGWLPVNIQWMAAFVCLIVAAIYLYEIWVTRARKRAWRGNLLRVVLSLGAAGVLTNGLLKWLSTPLLALSAACVALGVVASLADSGDASETPE